MTAKTDKKVLIAGFTGMFFFGVAFTVMGAILPSLSSSLNLSELQSSTLAGLLPLGILLGSLIFGPVIDRYGYKSLMIVSAILGAAGLEMLAFITAPNLLRFSIFILGISGGMLNGATNALVADSSSDKTKSANLSLLGFFYCVGAFAIPFILASLSKNFTYSPIVCVTGVVMFCAAIYFMFINFPQAKCKQGLPLKQILLMAKKPVLLILSFVLFFQSSLEGLSQTWMPKYLSDCHGFLPNQALYALSFIVVGMGISRLLLSFVLKKVSGKSVLITSMCISIIGVTIITLSASGIIPTLHGSNVSAVVAGAILIGMGFASTYPIVLGQIGEIFKNLSGTAFSFALVIALIGNTLMNLLLGYVGLTYLPVMLCCFIIMIVVLFIVGVGFGKKTTVS